MPASRRTFLKHATAAVGLISAPVFPRWLDTRLSADELLSDAVGGYDEAALRAIAQQALDTATSAGAQFADVRVNVGRTLGLRQRMDTNNFLPIAASTITIGVRAVVDGRWGFTGGTTLTPDGVKRVAQLAVSQARAARREGAIPFEYAPAPVVQNGRWQTPIEVDPFTVSVGEHIAIFRDALLESLKVKDSEPWCMTQWYKSDRLFASSDGSVTIQRTYTSEPDAGSSCARKDDRRNFGSSKVKTMLKGGYGFETVTRANLKAEWRRAAEEAVRLAMAPVKSTEVGRYDLVLDATVMSVVLQSLGASLQLDRALGEKANGGGTTFAMPPLNILGKYEVGSPLVTVTGDRSQPHANATVGWDEEGVKPENFTLVKKGTVVDYITTRRYASEITSWYTQNGVPVRSHGCATRTGAEQPVLQLPNMTLQSGEGATSLDDLIKDVKRGYYVEVAPGISSDQQFLNLQSTGLLAYEIVNGKRGSLVKDLIFQFSMPQFWKNVRALGGSATAVRSHQPIDFGHPDYVTAAAFTAVPALVQQINVTNSGKES